MILVNEFLPNPKGSDTTGEWVELANTGSGPVDLSGWRLTNKAGKSHVLHQTIPAKSYLLLPRATTKLALRNSDEALTLFNSAGVRADQIIFPGTVPEGKSVGRMSGQLIVLQPSPGTENLGTALAYPKMELPLGRALNSGWGAWSILGLTLACAIILFAATVFIYRHSHEDKDFFAPTN